MYANVWMNTKMAFCSIKPKVAAARTFRNPANGGKVEVPERVVLKVKPLVSFMKQLGLK